MRLLPGSSGTWDGMSDGEWDDEALVEGSWQQREPGRKCGFYMERGAISTAKHAPAWPKSPRQQKFRARLSSQTPRLTSRQTPLVLNSLGFTSPSKRGCKDHHGHQKLQPPGTIPDAATTSLPLVSAIKATTRKPWLDSSNLLSANRVMPPGFLEEYLKTSDTGGFGLGMLNT